MNRGSGDSGLLEIRHRGTHSPRIWKKPTPRTGRGGRSRNPEASSVAFWVDGGKFLYKSAATELGEHIPWPNYHDEDGSVGKTFHREDIPLGVLIDAGGKVMFYGSGYEIFGRERSPFGL